MKIIDSYSPGSNITILNTSFIRRIDPNDNKYKEYLTIVFKDADTGLKYKQEIINPHYQFYVAKEDKRVNYNRLFISKEDCDMYEVKYSDLEKTIAEITGNKDIYYQNYMNVNKSDNRKLHLHHDIFNSDMNIEDHYRFLFDKTYKNNIVPITKAFFDIEVDGINMISDFPLPGECPINSISVILPDNHKVFSLLLRNKINPLIDQFEKEVTSGSIYKEIDEFVINAVGGPSMADKYDTHFDFNFMFYDEEDEINLIKDLFSIFNSYKPDFALAWNMAFDIPYIIERIIKLGYDPKDIMCHHDFENKCAIYVVDERMKNEYAERSDFGIISSYTVYLDQMIHFASRRKGQSKFLSFSLDYIGETIAGVNKLDYKNITTNIMKLPYKSYKTFVFYNIMDTVVQHCIEVCTGDLQYLFAKSLVNNTRYNKVHRQTVYLANRATKEFYNEGFIIGNNINKFNNKPDIKFPGAFVANPSQINNYSRYKIYGSPIDVFDNDIDLDYSALYPSIIRQWNIAPNTQIGLAIIDKQIHIKENKRKFEHWTRASEFMEDFHSHVWLEICKRWFNLAGYAELYHEFERFFTEEMIPTNGFRMYDRSGLISPFIFIPDNKNMTIDPFIYTDSYYKSNNRFSNRSEKFIVPDITKWKEFIENAIENPNQQF